MLGIRVGDSLLNAVEEKVYSLNMPFVPPSALVPLSPRMLEDERVVELPYVFEGVKARRPIS